MELAIEFVKYVSDRQHLEDFIFMSNELQKEIYNQFIKEYEQN